MWIERPENTPEWAIEVPDGTRIKTLTQGGHLGMRTAPATFPEMWGTMTVVAYAVVEEES